MFKILWRIISWIFLSVVCPLVLFLTIWFKGDIEAAKLGIPVGIEHMRDWLNDFQRLRNRSDVSSKALENSQAHVASPSRGNLVSAP